VLVNLKMQTLPVICHLFICNYGIEKVTSGWDVIFTFSISLFMITSLNIIQHFLLHITGNDCIYIVEVSGFVILHLCDGSNLRGHNHTCQNAEMRVGREICRQFHHRLRFSLIFWRQKIAKPNLIREELLNSLSCIKSVCKMLMKLTPGFLKNDPRWGTDKKERVMENERVENVCEIEETSNQRDLGI